MDSVCSRRPTINREHVVATDVILLGLSCLGLFSVALIADPDPGFSNALSDFFAALPHTFEGMWQAMADLPMVWAAVILIGALIRRRRSIARDMVLSVVVGVVAWLLLARTVGGGWPECCEAFSRTVPPPLFPAARLAVPGAAIITASPHLVRPARRLGHWVLLRGSIATIALAASTLIGVLAGILCAAAAASAVHLAVGSSAGRPSLDDVRFALGQMGVVTSDLGVAARQPSGQFAVAATGTDGDELIVKVYGRDAYDAALLSTVQRTIWLRRAGSPVGFGRLRQVEHEAFLTLLAGQAGVPTDQVVIAGSSPSDDALLVLRRTGTLVAPAKREITVGDGRRSSGSAVTDALERMRELWELVERLHDNAIAHGQIDEAHLIVDHDGRLGLVDFRGASVAPTEAQLRSDEVQAFVATVILAGRDLAIAGARFEPVERAHRSPAAVPPTGRAHVRSTADDQRPRPRPRRGPLRRGGGDQPRGPEVGATPPVQHRVGHPHRPPAARRVRARCRRSPGSTSTSSSNRCRTRRGGSWCSA